MWLMKSYAISIYTVLQKYAHIGLNQNLFRSTTLDIITRLHYSAVFVCVHVVGSFQKISRKCVVEKSRVSALGWMDDSSTVHGIMKRSVKNSEYGAFSLTLFIKGFFGWCSIPPPSCNSVFEVKRLKFSTELLWDKINILQQKKSASNA